MRMRAFTLSEGLNFFHEMNRPHPDDLNRSPPSRDFRKRGYPGVGKREQATRYRKVRPKKPKTLKDVNRQRTRYPSPPKPATPAPNWSFPNPETRTPRQFGQWQGPRRGPQDLPVIHAQRIPRWVKAVAARSNPYLLGLSIALDGLQDYQTVRPATQFNGISVRTAQSELPNWTRMWGCAWAPTQAQSPFGYGGGLATTGGTCIGQAGITLHPTPDAQFQAQPFNQWMAYYGTNPTTGYKSPIENYKRNSMSADPYPLPRVWAAPLAASSPIRTIPRQLALPEVSHAKKPFGSIPYLSNGSYGTAPSPAPRSLPRRPNRNTYERKRRGTPANLAAINGLVDFLTEFNDALEIFEDCVK